MVLELPRKKSPSPPLGKWTISQQTHPDGCHKRVAVFHDSLNTVWCLKRILLPFTFIRSRINEDWNGAIEPRALTSAPRGQWRAPLIHWSEEREGKDRGGSTEAFSFSCLFFFLWMQLKNHFYICPAHCTYSNVLDWKTSTRRERLKQQELSRIKM